MILFQLIENIKFLFYAKNGHGLHSPFVFDFYNEVKNKAKNLYLPVEKPTDFNKKQIRIQLAIIKHLKITNVLIIGDELFQIQNLFHGDLSRQDIYSSTNLTFSSKDDRQFDLIYLSKSLLISEKDLFAKIQPFISERSVVIIPHIHASKNSLDRWESLIKNDSVRVSMDLFFIGILLFRKELTKQNFLLRF